MKYTFEIVGVSPIVDFFHHQQQTATKPQTQGVEYLGSHKCTLDALIETVEEIPSTKWSWEKDKVVDTVIEFWMNNPDSIHYWKSRLVDAGSNNLIVARLADIKSLRSEFESLLGEDW
ncbi:MAG: hypothetical protein QNJ47_17920 [Nostocaceae cyanobacterium]|nr:hypothetical protein [Nostocaceae cyanobacterium]